MVDYVIVVDDTVNDVFVDDVGVVGVVCIVGIVDCY